MRLRLSLIFLLVTALFTMGCSAAIGDEQITTEPTEPTPTEQTQPPEPIVTSVRPHAVFIDQEFEAGDLGPLQIITSTLERDQIVQLYGDLRGYDGDTLGSDTLGRTLAALDPESSTIVIATIVECDFDAWANQLTNGAELVVRPNKLVFCDQQNQFVVLFELPAAWAVDSESALSIRYAS